MNNYIKSVGVSFVCVIKIFNTASNQCDSTHQVCGVHKCAVASAAKNSFNAHLPTIFLNKLLKINSDFEKSLVDVS